MYFVSITSVERLGAGTVKMNRVTVDTALNIAVYSVGVKTKSMSAVNTVSGISVGGVQQKRIVWSIFVHVEKLHMLTHKPKYVRRVSVPRLGVYNLTLKGKQLAYFIHHSVLYVVILLSIYGV